MNMLKIAIVDDSAKDLISARNYIIECIHENRSYININYDHLLRINLKNQEIIANTNYIDCQKQLLNDKRFLKCHHRIIINMDYIKSMENEDFILDNAVKIPISQRKRRESKLKYMKYLANK